MLSALSEKRITHNNRIIKAQNEILDSQQELDDAYSAKITRLPKDSYGYSLKEKS
jgi:hypothetical protein